jgi:hypothetical protein
MGVVISKPAINLREQLTEASAVVPYEQRQFHFDNLVTNGTFDTNTDWTFAGSGWSIDTTNGVATHAAGAVGYLQQAVGQTPGKAYHISFNVSGRTAGSFSVNLGLTSFIANASTNGTFNLTGVPTNTNTLTITGDASFDGSFDNVSVYTSDGTDVAFTMPKGWKPLHVYDDGVLQREGSAEDYEVTFDGFHYYVKPTVANPGARNTVIGVRA